MAAVADNNKELEGVKSTDGKDMLGSLLRILRRAICLVSRVRLLGDGVSSDNEELKLRWRFLDIGENMPDILGIDLI